MELPDGGFCVIYVLICDISGTYRAVAAVEDHANVDNRSKAIKELLGIHQMKGL